MKILSLLVPAIAFLGTEGCRKSKKEPMEDGAKVTFTLAIAQNPTPSGFINTTDPSTRSLALPNFSSVPASGKNLKSLKIHIDNIQICKDLTLNGTAFSNTQGCVTIYQGPSNQRLNNTTNIADALAAAAESDDGFIDLMNAESLKKLNQSINIRPDSAGAFKYGIVNVSGPIKATAVMVDPADGMTPVLYSKATRPGECGVNNNPKYACAIATSSMTSAPAEEAIFIGINGGGMITKFQQPFLISEDDIRNRQTYALTLAFNPDSIIQGVTSGGATNFPPMTDASINDGYTLGNTMALVSPQVAAVFYKTSNGNIVTATPTPTPATSPAATGLVNNQTPAMLTRPISLAAGEDPNVLRESYEGTYSLSGGNGTAQLRIEFYSVSNDPEKTIYGVTTATIPNASTQTYLIGWQRVYGISTNSDGTINLLDYQGQKLLSNFRRTTTVGATTEGQLACDTVILNCTAGSTFNQSFVLSSLGSM